MSDEKVVPIGDEQGIPVMQGIMLFLTTDGSFHIQNMTEESRPASPSLVLSLCAQASALMQSNLIASAVAQHLAQLQAQQAKASKLYLPGQP